MQPISQFCLWMCLRWKTAKLCGITIHVATEKSRDASTQTATVSSLKGLITDSSTLAPLYILLWKMFLTRSALVACDHVPRTLFKGVWQSLNPLDEKAKMTAGVSHQLCDTLSILSYHLTEILLPRGLLVNFWAASSSNKGSSFR